MTEVNHTVKASPETVHWGYFSASLDPVCTINSGDCISVETVSGTGDAIPESGFSVPDSLLAINESGIRRSLPGHICTGPISVKGAKPGHVLQVDILDIDLAFDWGYTGVRPLRGALPYGFQRRVFHSSIDKKARIALTPWGDHVPLRPFFGVLGVAPPKAWGDLSTIQPRHYGGNIDNKELVAGSTIYLPVFEEGALFSVGDGHAAQGDGEVCVNAIETGLNGRFRLSVREDLELTWPFAETDTHVMTMAFDASLDACSANAVSQMIEVVCRRSSLDRHEAYALCSMVGDLRISQVVNDNKGVHFMLPKRYLNRNI